MASKEIPPSSLKGRLLEIYQGIIAETQGLPGGYMLPSVRELQRRYRAGQQTILRVLDELERQQLIQRFRRKGVRIAPVCGDRAADAVTQVNTPFSDNRHSLSIPRRQQSTQLLMQQMLVPIWIPLVEKFNRFFPNWKISIVSCVSTSELFQSSANSSADFILFPTNPCLLDSHCNTWQFMDLRKLMNTLDCSCFYDALAVEEPGGRVIGIAPSLGITMLYCREAQCQPPPPLKWNWKEFIDYGRNLLRLNPKLKYACFLDGYIYYLYHSGQLLIQPETGQLHFSYDGLAKPLERLKRMVRERIVPIFSEMYEQDRQYTLFSQHQLAIFEQTTGWQFDANGNCLQRPIPRENNSGVLASEQFSIRASSMRYESCWEFIKFMLSEEIQKDLAESQRCFPVRRGIFSTHTPEMERPVFEEYLNGSSRRLEDFYFPLSARYVLEVGIDQWLKMGGNLREILQNLERSCRGHIHDSSKR